MILLKHKIKSFFPKRKIKIQIRGITTLIGASCINFVIGALFSLLTLAIYEISYIKGKGGKITIEDITFYYPIEIFFQCIFSFISGIMYQKLGLHLTNLIGVIILCSGYIIMYISSSLALDLVSMSLGGIGTGIIFYPSTMNSYEWFKDHNGIIVGIMETMISFGSFFFSYIGEKIINKNEIRSNDEDNLYDFEIGKKIKYYLIILIICLISAFILSLILMFEKKNKNYNNLVFEDSNNNKNENISDLKMNKNNLDKIEKKENINEILTNNNNDNLNSNISEEIKKKKESLDIIAKDILIEEIPKEKENEIKTEDNNKKDKDIILENNISEDLKKEDLIDNNPNKIDINLIKKMEESKETKTSKFKDLINSNQDKKFQKKKNKNINEKIEPYLKDSNVKEFDNNKPKKQEKIKELFWTALKSKRLKLFCAIVILQSPVADMSFTLYREIGEYKKINIKYLQYIGSYYFVFECISSFIFGILCDYIQLKYLLYFINIVGTIVGYIYCLTFKNSLLFFIIHNFISFSYGGYYTIKDCYLMKVYGKDIYIELSSFVSLLVAFSITILTPITFFIISKFENKDQAYWILFISFGSMSLIGLILNCFLKETPINLSERYIKGKEEKNEQA